MPLIELVVMGHVDIPGAHPEASYFSVLGFECCRQVVDVVSGFGELLGGNGGPPFDGGGETEGHCVSNLAEFFFAELDEHLGRAGRERGVAFVWQVDADTERWWGDFLD
jgi:hypothetical protein